MNANNTLAAQEATARLISHQGIQDLRHALPSCFVPSPLGISVQEGHDPSVEDYSNGVAMMSSMVEMAGAIKGSFNLMLGDLLRLLRAQYGEDEAERVKGLYIASHGRAAHTVDQVEKVCCAFPDLEEREGLEFTHLQLLMPKKHEAQKGKIPEEEVQDWLEKARNGEKVLKDGEVVDTKSLSTSKLRLMLQEASGKAPRVAAELRDPTGDAERLRKAEAVCEALKELKQKLPTRWTLIPPEVVGEFEAWDAHGKEQEP